MSHSTMFLLTPIEDERPDWWGGGQKFKEYLEEEYGDPEDITLEQARMEYIRDEYCFKEWDFEENGFLDGYRDSVSNLETREEIVDNFKWLDRAYEDNDYFSIYEYATGEYAIKFTKEQVNKFVNDTLDAIENTIDLFRLGTKSFWDIDRALHGDRGAFHFYKDGTFYTFKEWFFELKEWYFNRNPRCDYFVFRLDDAMDFHS